jgi:septal ring factor EnvC (AmiA/AmiB activator)
MPTCELGSFVRSIRHRAALTRMTIAAALAAAALWPAPTAAQEPSTEEELESVRERAAAVAGEIDVIEAEDAEIQAALAAIQTEVAGQQVVVNAANDEVAIAEADVASSEEAIANLETQIVELDAQTERIVIDAYMNPPMDHALDMFDSATLSEATIKDALVDMQTEADADAIEQLDTAQTELETQKAAQEELAAVASAKKAEADQALADLNAALEVQRAFATEVESRLNAKLAESQALAAQDAALARQLAQEQAALAAALAAAEAQPATEGSTVTPAPGGLADVTCPSGGTITVAGSIASNVQALLDASSADGIVLCGGGYRDPQEQIELREAHCGTSDYAIYEMPSSQCTPPTARPGSSMHEQGLAIDFTCDGGGTVDSGDSCFVWLSDHAAEYGLYNLPSEPWHWSTNGN